MGCLLREEVVERARIVDQCPEFLDLAVLVEVEDLGAELLEPAVIALVLVTHEDGHVGLGCQDVMHFDSERAKVRNDSAEEGSHRLLAAVGTGVGAAARDMPHDVVGECIRECVDVAASNSPGGRASRA